MGIIQQQGGGARVGFTCKITYTRIVLNPVETLWRLPRVTHCEAAAALSQGCAEMRKALLAVGRCVWVWEGPRRRLCAENISIYERAVCKRLTPSVNRKITGVLFLDYR